MARQQNLAEQLVELKTQVTFLLSLIDNSKLADQIPDNGSLANQLALVKSLIAHSGPPALMGMESLKVQREQQWGNEQEGKAPRGWDRYRCTTFLEVISAKLDRGLQANQHIQDARADSALTPEERQEKIDSLEFDGVDSLKDAFNYLRKSLQKIEETPGYYTNNTLP